MINSETLVQVILQIVLSSIFICVFFFTYGKTQEEKSLERQISFLIDDFIGNKFFLLGDFEKDVLKGTIKDLEIDTSESDEKIKKSNEEVWNNTKKFILYMMVAGGVSVYLLWNSSTSTSGMWKSFNLSTSITDSMLAVAVVALIEFIFLTYLGSKFITIDTNLIKSRILTNIQDYIKSTN